MFVYIFFSCACMHTCLSIRGCGCVCMQVYQGCMGLVQTSGVHSFSFHNRVISNSQSGIQMKSWLQSICHYKSLPTASSLLWYLGLQGPWWTVEPRLGITGHFDAVFCCRTRDQLWSHLAKNINSSKSHEASRWQHYEWDRPDRTYGFLLGPGRNTATGKV